MGPNGMPNGLGGLGGGLAGLGLNDYGLVGDNQALLNSIGLSNLAANGCAACASSERLSAQQRVAQQRAAQPRERCSRHVCNDLDSLPGCHAGALGGETCSGRMCTVRTGRPALAARHGRRPQRGSRRLTAAALRRATV
jgi:hypothetical protein